jgi:hypothetical protein
LERRSATAERDAATSKLVSRRTRSAAIVAVDLFAPKSASDPWTAELQEWRLEIDRGRLELDLVTCSLSLSSAVATAGMSHASRPTDTLMRFMQSSWRSTEDNGRGPQTRDLYPRKSWL